MTVIDEIQSHAMRQRTSPALVINHAGAADEVVSYQALLDAVLRRAQVLRRNGLRAEDRCGLVARQGREFIEGALAILASGACMVPLAHDASQDAIAAVHARCQLHALLRGSDAWSLETFAQTRPIDGQEDCEYRALQPAYVRFTSGTTNVRKGVLIGHEAILARLAAANAALSLGPGDRVLWLLPMEHHFVVSILLYLSAGATIVLPDSVLPNDLLETASRHRVTFLYASPYHYKLLCRASASGDLSQVRTAISTTSGLTPDVAEAFAQRFKVPLGQALGIIEVGLPVINTGRAGERLASLGRPLPAYDVWLRDDSGGRVTATGPDAIGEICIRGAGLFDAYLDPWIPARKVLQPDGFRTGDQGWFDADGCLQLAGGAPIASTSPA